MADQAFHVRSISLPSRSNPAAAQIKEDLNKLRNFVASSTTEAVSDGLRGIGNVYEGIEEFLRLPCNQEHLAQSNQRKWVEEELDLSLRLLDLSGAVRDGLTSTRELLQDIQLSLRRKNCCYANNKIAHRHYSTPLHSIKKTIANSLRLMQKQMERSSKSVSCSAIDAVLVEARETLISLLQSASSFLATPRTNPKSSRWSLVYKAVLTKKVVSGEHEVEMGEESLAALRSNIQELEAVLASLVRRLIQNRVSLLNILSF